MLNYNLQPLTKSILQVFLLGLLFYALYLIQGILVYGIIALYISILGRPVIGLLGRSQDWAQAKHDNKSLNHLI